MEKIRSEVISKNIIPAIIVSTTFLNIPRFGEGILTGFLPKTTYYFLKSALNFQHGQSCQVYFPEVNLTGFCLSAISGILKNRCFYLGQTCQVLNQSLPKGDGHQLGCVFGSGFGTGCFAVRFDGVRA